MLCYTRHSILVILIILSLLCFLGCEKKEVGKIIITEKNFSLRQDGKNSCSLDVKGKIKNVGEPDLKQRVVTGYCRSCGEIVHQGNWFVNDLEKTPIQKDTIAYLAEGSEEDFSFKEVAYYWAKAGEEPENVPEEIEIVIESFKTVD